MNKHLEKALNDYLSQKDVDGAFYIDGPWGSGKSYYIRDFQKRFNEKNKNGKSKADPCLYVSLNGMRDINAINAELFSQCHPKLSKISNSKVMKFLLGLGGAVGSYFGVDSKDFLEDLKNGISSWTSNECSILILDDFERCRIDLQELFGFISSLINENKVKVILIGNDVEVRRYLQEESVYKAKSISAQISSDVKTYQENLKTISEPLVYDSIKEKCIYRTYYFQFDENIVFNELVTKYPKSMRTLVKRNRNAISNILSRHNCCNLRTCKVALDNYRFIMSNTRQAFSCKQEIKTVVLLSTVLCTVLCKNGREEGTFSGKMLFQNSHIYPIVGIEKFVYNSVWYREAVLKDLVEIDKEMLTKKSKELPKALKDLDGEWYLKTDEQIQAEIRCLKESLGSIPPLYYCKTLSLFFTYKQWFEKDNEIDLETITERLIENIRSSQDEIDLEEAFYWISNYPKELVPYLEKLKMACRDKNFELGNKTYFSMDSSALNGYSLDDLQKIDRDSYYYRCFFSRIDLKQLENTIETCDSATIFRIRTFLQNVYRVSNINDFFKDDLPSLMEFQKYLANFNSESIVKTKTVSLLKKDVDEYIQRIECD